jgi:hypothetical protein
MGHILGDFFKMHWATFWAIFFANSYGHPAARFSQMVAIEIPTQNVLILFCSRRSSSTWNKVRISNQTDFFLAGPKTAADETRSGSMNSESTSRA